ncbi:MAG: recombinase family protein [Oscillospiraceae bacterium]|jgi:site-specific DNA recombinase|nr:recombinase family protein [Oscillospiraceae bacterium]
METAIYVRVSTEEQAQEGFSIRAQEQKLKDFARVKDWSIFKIYMDEGISGKNLTERPAVQEMIADIENGDVKNVLVFKIDRLTRSTADLVYLIDLFNQKDCSFNSLTESIDTLTASGRMFLKIIGIFAEFERENIIERVKVGIERKVREGYTIGGNVSYGYDRPKHQKVQTINEYEAEIVKEIFDMFVNQGVPINDIARRLNVRKIGTKNDVTWGSTAIRRLLANSNYIGNVRHHIREENEYSVEGKHEPIISQEQFDIAQKILQNNKKSTPTKKPREESYFSGFLRCGTCGYKMVTHNIYNTLKDGTKSITSSYRCQKKSVKACTSSSISHKKLEVAFYEYITGLVDLDAAEQVEIESQKKQENQAQIKAYEKKLQKLKIKESEAMSLYVADEMTFENYREIKRLVDKETAIINAELEKLHTIQDEMPVNKTDIIKDFNENWEWLTTSERRQFLLQFMGEITVTAEKEKGQHFATAIIQDVAFLPSPELNKGQKPLLQQPR